MPFSMILSNLEGHWHIARLFKYYLLRYDTVRYIYVRSKADEIACLI